MWDERKAIGVLLSVCTAEIDRRASFDDESALLHGIARELESLADVLHIEHLSPGGAPARRGLLPTYRRVLELPLARTIRTVLSHQLSRLEHNMAESRADVA